MENKSKNSYVSTQDELQNTKETTNRKNQKSSEKNNKKNKKIKSIIEYIIIVLVIIGNGIWIFQTVNKPGETPSAFGKKAFVVISGSMIPTINIGDIAIFNDTNIANVGDIIAFRNGSSIIVHRIVKRNKVDDKIFYLTKGDNNTVVDGELVKTSDIEGVYITKIPFIGLVLMWLYDNLAIVVAIIVLFIIIRFYFSR